MSFFQSLLRRTTVQSRKATSLFASTLLAVLYTASTPLPAGAQANGADIYKKMTDVYSNAKAYQGTITRLEKGQTPQGKPATQTTTVKINFKAPNKFLVANTTSGASAGKSVTMHQSMVCDGKSLVMFSTDKKLYQKAPAPTDNTLARFFAVLNPTVGFTLQPETTVNSRPAYVLKPNVPANLTPQQKEQAKKVKILLMVDKQTYQFLKLTIDSGKGSLVQTVTGQVLNGTVAESQFSWTPPAGYKEQTPPPSTGGAPSIPGIH